MSEIGRAETISANYDAPLDLLNDKVILITGAADGIGRELSIQCAGHGAEVILLDQNVRALERVYDQIEHNGGPQPAIYPFNLAKAGPDDYDQLADAIAKNFDRLDALVHNAASLGQLSPLHQQDINQWYSVLQVNLSAPFLLTRSLLGLLAKGKDPSVLFSSDSVGRRGKAYWGAYGVSKFGLEGMMQILADELRDTTRIRVNSIDPGPCQTALRRNAYPAEDASTLPKIGDIIGSYLYVLGLESQHLHGCTLSVKPCSGVGNT